jgi:twitching motility protein PilT
MDITELLAFSVQQGASDLHLSAGLPPMIRVDGDIRRVNVLFRATQKYRR